MFSLLVQKELKNILLSPKFAATFLICSVLIILSVFIGIKEYQNAMSQYQANQKITQQQIENASGWNSVRNIAHRKPVPMQVFVSGLHYDIGRLSNISTYNDVKMIRSPYSDEPLFAIFRYIDLTFIFQVVFSLIAILFTYDAINGERENGTLKLAFANSVSRAQYLISKLIGIWIGLVIPLLVPLLIGLLLVMAFNIPIESTDWISIATFAGLSILYLTLFIVVGLLISSLTKKSGLSFLLLLVIWIFTVLIIPRLGVMTAGQIIPVDSIAQTEAKQEAFERNRWDQYSTDLSQIWQQRNAQMQNMSAEERTSYREEKEWEWLVEDDKVQKQVHQDIIENNRVLLEETQNKKKLQEKLALNLARISPASSYRLAAMNLATTNIELKNRYEQSMRQYRDLFVSYIDSKSDNVGSTGFKINFSSSGGISMQMGDRDQSLDTGDMPQFQAPEVGISETIAASITDFGLLSIFTVLCFGGSFLAFLRYDMR